MRDSGPPVEGLIRGDVRGLGRLRVGGGDSGQVGHRSPVAPGSGDGWGCWVRPVGQLEVRSARCSTSQRCDWTASYEEGADFLDETLLVPGRRVGLRAMS